MSDAMVVREGQRQTFILQMDTDYMQAGEPTAFCD